MKHSILNDRPRLSHLYGELVELRSATRNRGDLVADDIAETVQHVSDLIALTDGTDR